MNSKAKLHIVQPPDLCSLVIDQEARRLYDRMMEVWEELHDLGSRIAYVTVGGQETRSDLSRAVDLMEATVTVVKRAEAREAPWFDLLEELAPRQVWHREACHGE